MLNETEVKLFNFIMKDILNGITEDDILKFRGGKFYVDNIELTPGQAQEVIGGAQALQVMPTFKLLMNDLKKAAQERIFNESNDFDAVLFGKAALWITDIMQRKVDNLAKIEMKPIKAPTVAEKKPEPLPAEVEVPKKAPKKKKPLA